MCAFPGGGVVTLAGNLSPAGPRRKSRDIRARRWSTVTPVPDDQPTDAVERVDWLLDRGRVDEALTLLSAIADRADLGDLTWLTDVLAENGRLDEAVAEWQQALAAELPGARGSFAAMLAAAGRTGDATAGWRAAVAAGERDASTGLARHLVSAGQLTEAEAIFRTVLAGGDPEVAPDLVRLLLDAERTDEAVAVSRAVLSTPGGPPWPLGKVLEERGLTDDAIEVYRAVLAAGRGHIAGRLSRLLHQQGRVDETIAVLRAATEDRDVRFRAWRQLGYVLAANGREDDLETETERCASIEDGFFRFTFAAGVARGLRHLAGQCSCDRPPA